mmetsp:Transcript_39066/g.99804  ORF Transcript_39066/g.99804 Transcript_39066/m.99804 type:complete len:249 (-) Transcript_39066:707-1453(-)
MPLAATSSIMAAFRITACRTVATRRPCSTTARWTSSRAMTRRTRFSSSTPSTCCTPRCRCLSRTSRSWTGWSKSQEAAPSILQIGGSMRPWSFTWTPWSGIWWRPSRIATCTGTRSLSSWRTMAARCTSPARPTTTRSRGASTAIGRAACVPTPSSPAAMCQRTGAARSSMASSPSPTGTPRSPRSRVSTTSTPRRTRPTATSTSTASRPCRRSMAGPSGTTLSVAQMAARIRSTSARMPCSIGPSSW